MRGRKPPGLVKAVQAPNCNLTVFKIKWGNITFKIYDKGKRVSRIEVVVHIAKELHRGTVLKKLPVLLERMNSQLVSFLDTLQAARAAFALGEWSEPTARDSRRLAGIDLNKVRNRHAVNAVVELPT